MSLLVAVLVFVSLLCLDEARRARGAGFVAGVVGQMPGASTPRSGRLTVMMGRVRSIVPAIASACAGALLGSRLLGPIGLIGGAACGWAAPTVVRRRSARRRGEVMERQLAEVVETAALAVRSGLSIGQALEFSAADVGEPMDAILQRLLDERRLGVPVDECLQRFADELDTDDARMFVLILSIHLRSGGNVAAALEEVSNAVHHRIAVRRELRALTAQGRVSGTIMGALPIGFFLVLAATSQRDLAPVYRSTAGIAMLGVGFGLEGLAFLWIRRLLRVTV